MVEIRKARVEDVGRLTEVARAAKAHWGYPEAWLELWRDELTYTAATLEAQTVFVAEQGGEVVGVAGVSVAGAGEGAELEGLWVDPAAMGAGVGRALLLAVVEWVRDAGGRVLVVVSDPGAEGFYRKMGAVRVGWVASRPEGRRLPRLELELELGVRG